jgi:DNA-directed RNA polymerase
MLWHTIGTLDLAWIDPKEMTMTKVWMPNIADPVMNETAWERQMQFSGLERFERSRVDKQASETAGGQRMMRRLIKVSTISIEQMQKDILGINRVSRELKATVLMVPSETSALLTLRCLMNNTYNPSSMMDGVTYQLACRNVAQSIEMELNFMNWLAESKRSAEDYAKLMGLKSVPKSQAERLLAESGMDARTLRRWKKSFEELNKYKWDTLTEHYCGEALVATVVNALPDVFETHVAFKGGKKLKHVRMTNKFRKELDNMESRIAHIQVVKKPMLARPKPWTKGD